MSVSPTIWLESCRLYLGTSPNTTSKPSKTRQQDNFEEIQDVDESSWPEANDVSNNPGDDVQNIKEDLTEVIHLCQGNNEGQSQIDMKLNFEKEILAKQNDERVEIHPALHVSADKLNSLFKRLEVDKLNINQENEENSFLPPTSIQQEYVVEAPPRLRKTSSLKSYRSPPATPAGNGRKIVR